MDETTKALILGIPLAIIIILVIVYETRVYLARRIQQKAVILLDIYKLDCCCTEGILYVRCPKCRSEYTWNSSKICPSCKYDHRMSEKEIALIDYLSKLHFLPKNLGWTNHINLYPY